MRPELVFPKTPLEVGKMPFLGPPTKPTSAPEWAQFKYGDMLDGRAFTVDDDGWPVLEVFAKDTDRTAYSGSARAEVYRDKVWSPGDVAVAAFGLKLPTNLPPSPPWSSLWQMHTPPNYGTGYASPMCVLSLDGGKLTFRNNSEGTLIGQFPFAQGRWQFFVVENKLARPGRVRVWQAYDRIPNVAADPTFNVSLNTIPPSPGRDGEPLAASTMKLGVYIPPGSTGRTYSWRVDGYVEANTVERAVELLAPRVRPSARPVTAPPEPTVQELIAESIAEHRRNAWYYVKFLEHNPILAPLVVEYLDGTGRRPTEDELGQNHYARGLVLAEDARRRG